MGRGLTETECLYFLFHVLSLKLFLACSQVTWYRFPKTDMNVTKNLKKTIAIVRCIISNSFDLRACLACCYY